MINEDDSVGAIGALDPETCFLAVKAELEALEHDEVVALNVDLEQAVSTALGASVRLQALRPGFARLDFADEHEPDRLAVYAYAALYTHVLAGQVASRDERLPKLLDEALPLRERLLGTAELMAELGELSRQPVAAIRSGTGHLDIASCLIALACLFEANWSRLNGRVPVTREQVARARMVGRELYEVIGTRRYVPAPIPMDDPGRLRARAFTLLVRSYDRCRRAVVALRWHEGDADAFMPTLYPKRRRRATVAIYEIPALDAVSAAVPANGTPMAGSPANATPTGDGPTHA